MPEIRRAQFPRHPCTHFRLHNLVATRRPVLDLEIAGASTTLRLGPITDLPGDCMTLSASSRNAWLTLGAHQFEQWLKPWIGGETLNRLPPALRAAARQAALTPLLDALQTAIGVVFDFTDEPDPPSASAVRLGLWLADDAEPFAALWLDDATAAALTARLESLPPADFDQEPWPMLPVPITLWIGQTRLTAPELRHLEMADILLLPPSLPGLPFEAILRQPNRPLAVARFQRRQLFIDHLTSTAMSESAPADNAPASFINPDDLEIRLDFDLGHLTLPLRELRAMQPGYSFELDRPEAQPVRIVAGSQVIGHGELVHIDDRLGVRVVALFQPPESAE